MKRLPVLLSALLLSAAPALAQSEYSRSSVTGTVNSTIYQNTTKNVTGNAVNAALLDIINSSIFGQSDLGSGVLTAMGLTTNASGGLLTWPINLATSVSGTLSVTNGGTGATTLTSGEPIFGNGTSAVTFGTLSGNTTKLPTTTGTLTSGDCVSIDSHGNFIDNGSACGSSGGSGTVGSGTVGELPVYTGTTAVAGTNTGTGVVTAIGVNVGSAGSLVVNGGVLGTPSSGTITNLSGTPSSIGLANGTGLPISGTTGWGTGVATALATNVGSAGAPVVNGGALGTPSSGTMTNLSGTPSSIGLANGTGLPIAGVTGWGTGVATALAANVNGSGAILSRLPQPLSLPLLARRRPEPSPTRPELPLTTGITGTLGVAHGGTGATTLATGDPLFGAGTSPITTGTLSGNTTELATASGSLTNGHCVSIDASGNFVDAGGACTTGGGGGTVSSGTAGQITYYASTGTVVSGTTTGTGVVTALGNNVTGSGGIVLATSPTLVTPALGTPSALVLTNATGTPSSIGLANGTGLSLTSGVSGVLPYANGGTGLSALGTGNQCLTTNSGATAMAWAACGGGISFPNQAVTGATSGGIPYFNSTTQMSSSALLAANAVMIGGGAATAPSTTTTGTNVLTAIGNATNAASGLVQNNSSGYIPFLDKVGAANASTAASGNIGEIISSHVASGSAISLTSGTAANITSVSLSAGDWQCTGNIQTNGSAGDNEQLDGWLSTTSATFPTTPELNGSFSVSGGSFNNTPANNTGIVVYNVSSPTTVYLSVRSYWTGGGTQGAFGLEQCIRFR